MISTKAAAGRASFHHQEALAAVVFAALVLLSACSKEESLSSQTNSDTSEASSEAVATSVETSTDTAEATTEDEDTVDETATDLSEDEDSQEEADDATESVIDELSSSSDSTDSSSDTSTESDTSTDSDTSTETESDTSTDTSVASDGCPVSASEDCAASSDGKSLTREFSSCPWKANESYLIDGTVSLAFDSADTCSAWADGDSLPTSGSLVRTSSDWAATDSESGDVVRLSSDLHQNYRGRGISGGSRVSFKSGYRLLEHLGIHKTVEDSEGNIERDQSIRTRRALRVSGRRGNGSLAIESGVIAVHHNLAEFTQTMSVENLLWREGCCHPVRGHMTVVTTGSRFGVTTVRFGAWGCGVAKFIRENGSEVLRALPACEPGRPW